MTDNEKITMEEINRYARRSYQPEEVYTFSMVLCDNEVDRDYEQFAVSSLQSLKELYLGKACIYDHSCGQISQIARIYHTDLERKPGAMNRVGEDLVQLTAKAYLPRTRSNQEMIERLESSTIKKVSVSCSIKRRTCSICGKEECGHEKGETYDGKLAYRVLLDPTDAYECAFVVDPYQMGAGVGEAMGYGEVLPQDNLKSSEAETALNPNTKKSMWKNVGKVVKRLFRWFKERWVDIIGIAAMILVIGLFVGLVYLNNTSYTEWGCSLSEISPGVYGMYNTVSSSIPAQNYEMVTVCCNGEICTFKGRVSIRYTNSPARMDVKDYNFINRDEITVFVPEVTIRFRENVGIGR